MSSACSASVTGEASSIPVCLPGRDKPRPALRSLPDDAFDRGVHFFEEFVQVLVGDVQRGCHVHDVAERSQIDPEPPSLLGHMPPHSGKIASTIGLASR